MSDAPPSLVDAHHHLWDHVRRLQAWLDDPIYAPIRRTFTLGDLRADATRRIAGRRLTTSVLVQRVTSSQETVEIGPAKFVLDLFVALLDPMPDPVEPHHFGQVGRFVGRAGGVVRSAGACQVGGQVPSGEPRCETSPSLKSIRTM